MEQSPGFCTGSKCDGWNNSTNTACAKFLTSSGRNLFQMRRCWRSNLTSIEAILMKHQLRWSGHVTRMDSERLPKAVFFGELSKGKHKRGAPRNRFKGQLKQHLSVTGISSLTWQQEAMDGATWCRYITEGCQKFESDRQLAATEERKKRKESKRDDPQSAPAHDFPCPKCGRVCAARIGLYSHRRACKK